MRQGTPLCGPERRQGLVVQAFLPVRLVGQEALEIGSGERVQSCLPGLSVGRELLAGVRQQPGVCVELGQRAWTERAKCLPDTIEQADLQLPGALVAPRQRKHLVDQRVEFLPTLMRYSL